MSFLCWDPRAGYSTAACTCKNLTDLCVLGTRSAFPEGSSLPSIDQADQAHSTLQGSVEDTEKWCHCTAVEYGRNMDRKAEVSNGIYFSAPSKFPTVEWDVFIDKCHCDGSAAQGALPVWNKSLASNCLVKEPNPNSIKLHPPTLDQILSDKAELGPPSVDDFEETVVLVRTRLSETCP
ncbi:hypothetical protein BTVI_130241 [Pitangus sulphuratus]|nr:hypothetical protein BTVI_130241 [Pitangus sulphuratus]